MTISSQPHTEYLLGKRRGCPVSTFGRLLLPPDPINPHTHTVQYWLLDVILSSIIRAYRRKTV